MNNTTGSIIAVGLAFLVSSGCSGLPAMTLADSCVYGTLNNNAITAASRGAEKLLTTVGDMQKIKKGCESESEFVEYRMPKQTIMELK